MLNEDCEKLRGQLKEPEEAALPIVRLLVSHPGVPKIAPLVDRLKEAPGHLATYVKHLAKSIPNEVLAYMKLYFPKALEDVVAGGLTANVDGRLSYQSSYGFGSGQIPRRSQGTLLPSSGEPKVSNPWNNVQHKDSI
jgi:hypothetical protein